MTYLVYVEVNCKAFRLVEALNFFVITKLKSQLPNQTPRLVTKFSTLPYTIEVSPAVQASARRVSLHTNGIQNHSLLFQGRAAWGGGFATRNSFKISKSNIFQYRNTFFVYDGA
jgi:hypothetical protein